MAATLSPRLRTPLSDSTSDINAQPLSPNNHTAKSRLQRTESHRAFHPLLDSSESEFSSHDSLYDAQPHTGDDASSEERKEESKEKSFEWQHETPLSAIPSLPSWDWESNQGPVAPSGEWDADAAPRHQPRIPNPAVHGYNYDSHPQKVIKKQIWVEPNLATIHERRSNSTIRTSLSLPRIPSQRASINTLSSTISSATATPHQPNFSPATPTALSPSTAPTTPTDALSPSIRTSPPTPTRSRRRKSLSLDAIILPSCRSALAAPFCSSSSSSDETHPSTHIDNQTYPTIPPHPPLTRTPTPPGLPSFGSREALRYQPRHSIAIPDPVFDADGSTTSSPNAVLAFIERVFSQPSPSSYSVSPPRSISLPPGVIAQAADGTMIRGRFGVRQSAHMGMSGGTIALERHPFHRDGVPLAQITPAARSSFDGAGQDSQHRTVRFSEEVEVAEGMCGSIGRSVGKKRAWGKRRKDEKLAQAVTSNSTTGRTGVALEASGAISGPPTRRHGILKGARRSSFPALIPQLIVRRNRPPTEVDVEQGVRQVEEQERDVTIVLNTGIPASLQLQRQPEISQDITAPSGPSQERARPKKSWAMRIKERLKLFWRNYVSLFLYCDRATDHEARGCRGYGPDTRAKSWVRWVTCGGYCCGGGKRRGKWRRRGGGGEAEV